MDKVYIIGVGAIGAALGILLKHAGRDVILVHASKDDVTAYRKNIQMLLNDGTCIESELDIRSLSSIQDFDGPVVLTNKSFGNERLAGLLKSRINNQPLVILQNGLGVEEPFIQQSFAHVYRCVLFVTSQFNDNGQLIYKPVARCPVGIIKGNGEVLDDVVNILSTSLFSFSAERDIQFVIWKKAIANCVFNSICPLLDTDNGVFYRDKTALSLAKEVVEECVMIANRKDIALTGDLIIESLLSISKASEGQFISTLQDIRKGRPTEIASLNAAVAKMAAELGLGDHVTKTKFLGELVSLKAILGN